MKKITLVGLIAAVSICSVQAATVSEASVSNSFSASLKCEDSSCTGPVKGKLAIAETVTISAIEEAELQSDTSVTLLFEGFFGPLPVELILSEDPNFQNGDTSAKIKKTIPLEEDLDLIVSVQLKWGSGELDIKVNGKIVGEMSLGTMLTKKNSKAVPELPLVVEVIRGITPVFTAGINLTGDIKILEFFQIKSTGDGSQKFATSFKSREFVPFP
jgi:hypothetical protein